jgi:DNA-binding response OmpR family regulator
MALVLVVDDDVDLGGVLVDLLEAHGLEARLALTGAEAVELLDQQLPELVVLDWYLPDGPPVRVAERCRGRQIPMILSSAANDSQCHAGEIGARSLPKPFDVDSFYQVVDELLHVTRIGDRPPA